MRHDGGTDRIAKGLVVVDDEDAGGALHEPKGTGGGAYDDRNNR
jgi:hypothetical protein